MTVDHVVDEGEVVAGDELEAVDQAMVVDQATAVTQVRAVAQVQAVPQVIAVDQITALDEVMAAGQVTAADRATEVEQVMLAKHKRLILRYSIQATWKIDSGPWVIVAVHSEKVLTTNWEVDRMLARVSLGPVRPALTEIWEE